MADKIAKNDKKVGLYLHIPFCLRKCGYCDFCSFPGADEQTVSRYVDRMCDEVSRQAELCRDDTVDTVYFGGGTPTLLPPEQFIKLLHKVYAEYRVEPDAEITTECNPATGDEAYFSLLRKEGVNRLSIGLQSADDRELHALGRIHTYGDFLRTYREARHAGFENVSVDLMFGIPEQTPESFCDTLRRVTSMDPDHVSVYGLILEEGTRFWDEKQSLRLPDEETERSEYMTAVEYLAGKGYDRYEISNFSRPGKQSRHNLRYWDCREYLGFGVSAHSFFGGERFANSRDLVAYLAGRDIAEERHRLTQKDARDEYVMLRLRLESGIGELEYQRRFGESFFSHYGKRFEPFLRAGLAVREADRLRLTSDGFYVSNTILSSVLDL